MMPPEGGQGHNMRAIGWSDLGGHGDVMQIGLKDAWLYTAHEHGDRMDVVDVSDPRAPKIVGIVEPPHPDLMIRKVQVLGDLMITNLEVRRGKEGQVQGGVRIYDVSTPSEPRPLSTFNAAGRGVHRLWFGDPGRAYLSAGYEGYALRILLILDVANPEHPAELGHWGMTGQWTAGGETPSWPAELRYQLHHGISSGNFIYCGWNDACLKILDVSNPAAPSYVGGVNWAPEAGGATHTTLPLPGRGLVVVTDEVLNDQANEPPKYVRIVDVHDPSKPEVTAVIEPPEGELNRGRLRFGPHNLHENRPDTFRSEDEIYVTYFGGGLRVYDIRDPAQPKDVASFVPPSPPGQDSIQLNDLIVGKDGIVYTGDRLTGGLWVLERT